MNIPAKFLFSSRSFLFRSTHIKLKVAVVYKPFFILLSLFSSSLKFSVTFQTDISKALTVFSSSLTLVYPF